MVWPFSSRGPLAEFSAWDRNGDGLISPRESGGAQHAGLGRTLVEEALRIAGRAGFGRLAVISAVGTRAYYRRAGFRDGELYQHRAS